MSFSPQHNYATMGEFSSEELRREDRITDFFVKPRIIGDQAGEICLNLRFDVRSVLTVSTRRAR